MDIFPADAEVTIDHAGLSAGDAMPNGADPTELFDVEMDQFAWVFAFIAADRFSRLQSAEPVQAEPAQDTTDSGWRDADLYRDLLARPALST
jgi:hypothetical protein